MAEEGCDSGAEEEKKMERWRGEEDEKEKSGRDLVFTSRADILQRCYLAELSLHLPLSRLLHSWPPQSFSPYRSSLSLSLVAPIDLSPPRRSPLPLAPPHYISALQWAAEKERGAQQSMKWCELLLQLAAFDRIPQPAIATVTRSNMALW